MFAGAALLVAALYVPIKNQLTQNKESAVATEKAPEKAPERTKRMGMHLGWFSARAYPDPYFLNDKYMAAWQQAVNIRENNVLTRGNKTLSGMWNNIGPNSGIGGRILTLAISPTNGNVIFAGSAGGGIWKTTDAGANWSHVETGLPVFGVSSIIIDPSNANTIYAGTGEVYRVDSTGTTPNPGNTSYSVWKTRGTYGIGVIKSTDGGATWSQVLTRSTPQMFGIQTLRFDPSNSNIVYAAATDGLYKSTNGGSSWTHLFPITYVSDVVANGNNIVVAVGNLGNTLKGIYKSTNSGANWSKISSALPASFQGYIKLDQVRTTPNTIVASIGVSSSASTEIYRSTDFGSTWSGLATSGHAQWQYWFAHDVAMNPSDLNMLVYAGVNAYKHTWGSSRTALSSTIHDDVHDIQFDPSNTSICYIACDGGVYRSANITAATPTWSQRNNGLGATQFYAPLGVSTVNPNFYVGGLQDNGQVSYNGTSWSTSISVGGDGAGAAIKPGADATYLISRDARGFYRGGGNVLAYWGSVADSRTAFAAPIGWSKSNTNVVYVASDNLHKSSSSGASGSWNGNAYGTASTYIDAYRKPAISLAVSPTDENKVYISVSNFAQYDNDVDNIYVTGSPNVRKTINGGTSFTTITGSGGNTLPNRFVLDFAISKGDDDSVFAAIGGFGTAHIYVTGDGGANWYPRGTGLPDVPFNAVLIDPLNPKVIYAGCDLGVYVSPNRGVTWYDFNNGITDAVPVFDLQATSDNQLLAATHGRGVFKGSLFSGLLPVDFLSFSGKAQASSNYLQWKVGTEINVSHYEIERSDDGTTFKKTGAVNATGASAYQFNDPIQDLITYYYRLKSVDHDGFVQYSDIIVLKRDGRDAVSIKGNPFRDQLTLQFDMSAQAKGQVRLYDLAGRVIKDRQVVAVQGTSTYQINDLGGLARGTYFVEAVFNGQRWKYKVIK